MATYFEASKSAAWSGIGTVNKDRLEVYRLLERDSERSNIDFIVSDKIFTYARTHNASLHGYGQAWALTHFLMEKKFSQFMQWYGRINKMTPKQLIEDKNLTSSFRNVFGSNIAGLDREWRSYMNGLKTDMELLID